jgi:hypothetical protein
VYLCTATVEECIKGTTLQIGSTTITPIKPAATITLDTCGEDGSDRDEAEGDDDEMEQGTSEDEVMIYLLSNLLNNIANLIYFSSFGLTQKNFRS